MSGLAKSYVGPPAVEALSGIEFTVNRGDYISIVGPSGSGKSTLLNLLGLLDTPTRGSYVFDGVDTACLSDRERTAFRAKNLGFMFQSFHLIGHRTVVENVAMPLIYQGVPTKRRIAMAHEKLDLLRLSHRAEALPTMLSGGEMQRVAIARALISNPPLLLCDEPTGNLDSVTADAVLSTIDSLVRQHLTVLIITHDQQVAARAHRTVTIRDGRLTPGNSSGASNASPRNGATAEYESSAR